MKNIALIILISLLFILASFLGCAKDPAYVALTNPFTINMDGLDWRGDLATAPTSNLTIGTAYHNTTDGNSYIYEGGTWNIFSEPGSTGPAGADGSDGSDGSTWYSDAGAPDPGDGANGDYYLNTTTSDVYLKSGGTWSIVANIKGSTGASGSNGSNGLDGKSVLNGSGAPGAGLGVDGDFYIDTTANGIYGPKATTWGSGTSLIGPAGSDGSDGSPGSDGQGFTWKGAWVTGSAYVAYDVVSDAGSSYECILAINPSNTAPASDGTHFELLASKGDTGSAGSNGSDGSDGLSVVWHGAYDNGHAYIVNDAVSSSGSSYICILNSTGNAVSNTTYWNLMSSKGDTGAAGVDGTNGTDGAAGSPGGTEATWYLDDTVGDLSYNELLPIPSTTAQQLDQQSSSGSSEVLIEGYATLSGSPNTTSIPAGDWYFDMYRYAESGGGTKEIVIRVYKKVLAGTETELFNTTTGSIADTTLTYQEVSTTQAAFTLLTTDRIVVKYYAKVSGGAAKIVYYTHNGTTHYSHIHYPSNVYVTDSTKTTLTGLLKGNGTVISSVTAPSGDVVGTTDNQALSNKSLTSPTFTGTVGSSIALASGYSLSVINALSDDHSFTGITTTVTAGEALVAFDCLYINSSSKFAKADADASTTVPVVAMSTATINNDATGTVLTWGFVRDDSWSWTVNGLIFASGTAGSLTQTAPTGTGKQVQVIGIAITSKIIMFNPQILILGLS